MLARVKWKNVQVYYHSVISWFCCACYWYSNSVSRATDWAEWSGFTARCFSSSLSTVTESVKYLAMNWIIGVHFSVFLFITEYSNRVSEAPGYELNYQGSFLSFSLHHPFLTNYGIDSLQMLCTNLRTQVIVTEQDSSLLGC